MAFDSKSIKALLDPKNEEFFGSEFPLFYKQGANKESAIDVALEMNQKRSVDLMVDYILKYQNSYVY